MSVHVNAKLFIIAVGVVLFADTVRSEELGSAEIFNQRILPIFRSPNPSSCVQCHLAAVDLKRYILPSHEKTFLSLRDQGLIDLDEPMKSKILGLIRMGEKDLDVGARLIHEEMRTAEYDAFANWIEACCHDDQLRAMPALPISERARPDRPDPVIRHGRKSRVVDSFQRNVWSQRMRCFPCHTPHEIDPSNPKHAAAVKTRQKLETQYGQDGMSRLGFFRETPAASMQYLITASQEPREDTLPLLNLQDPGQSLLVLKPTSKLPKKRDDGSFEPPSSRAPVSHMGGLKMHHDDQSYKSFLAWIQDYANVVGDSYVSVDDLPRDDWIPSRLVLRVTATPDEWPVGTPVQLFVHAKNASGDGWSETPTAFTQGTVTPRGRVNGTLFVFRAGDADPERSAEGATLPRDAYLVKAYVDQSNRVAQDPTALLGEVDFYGQGEIEDARWREGFRFAESIAGDQLKDPK